MKPTIFVYAVVLLLLVTACSDNSAKKSNVVTDPDVTHAGEQWNVTSAEYTLVDQGISSSSVNQTFKTGTKANAGAFYFDGTKGSFELDIENYHKEDVFNYSESSGNVTISSISQNVSTTNFSQNALVISGDRSTTNITLSGTITKQSTSGQFVLTVTLTLKKA
jgi:hypothetical protein